MRSPARNNALSGRPNWLLSGLIILLVAAAFAPALNGEFVAWDDFQNFVANRDFRGLGLAQLKWAWTTTLLGHYVPLSWMTLELDYALWGMNPRGYHMTS